MISPWHQAHNGSMKPLPAPHVPGNTEFERFDNAVRQVLSVSKEELFRREAREKKRGERKRRSKKASCSPFRNNKEDRRRWRKAARGLVDLLELRDIKPEIAVSGTRAIIQRQRRKVPFGKIVIIRYQIGGLHDGKRRKHPSSGCGDD